MSHYRNADTHRCIVDLVHDAMLPNSYPVETLVTTEFPHANGPRVRAQRSDRETNALSDLDG